MFDDLISIIVPVFNVQNYLNRCISSIVNQTYTNLEIILVDDGSTDECPKKCDEWALLDSRIRVIHKKNRGLGMARNTGIDSATGKLICFVDSDDTIDLDTIEECYKSFRKNNVDMICFGFKDIDVNDNVLREHIPTPSQDLYQGQSVINSFLPQIIVDIPKYKLSNLNLSSCMCMIRKRVIDDNSWRFVSERKIISEDVYSLLILYKSINSVFVIKKPFYNYRNNVNSLTRSYKKDRFEKVVELRNSLCKLYSIPAITERINYLFLCNSISCIKLIVGSNLSIKSKIKFLNDICNNNILRETIKSFFKYETFKRKIFLLCILLKNNYLVLLLTLFQIKKSN